MHWAITNCKFERVCGLTPAITKIWNSICYRMNLVKAEVIQELQRRHLFLKDLRPQPTDLWWLKFDLEVYKLHPFCVFGTSAHSSSERWRHSFCLGQFETIMISFYSSWILFIGVRVAGEENKSKISWDRRFQWYGSNNEHSRDLMASPIIGILPARYKVWKVNICTETIGWETQPKFPPSLWPSVEQFNQTYQNRQLQFPFHSENNEPRVREFLQQTRHLLPWRTCPSSCF